MNRNARGFLTVFLLLLVLGLVVLYAASFYNAQDTVGGQYAEVLSQLMGIALGAVMMLVVSRIDYRVLRKPIVCGGLLLVSLTLLALVPVPGIGRMINGSRRWLRLGPISFQPSELAKYAMVLFMARALSRREAKVSRLFTGVAPMLIVPAAMFFLVLLQPNLSTAGSILIVAAVMVMMAGAKWRHLVLLGAGGTLLGAFYTLSEPYRRARLMSFRDPFAKLTDEGYQLAQSLLAFGSGGLAFLRRDLVTALARLVESGISVVVCSQCLYEGSDMTTYEVGRRALQQGVIPGGDMTSEAAVTKLMWALANTRSLQEVSALFAKSLAGEISVS